MSDDGKYVVKLTLEICTTFNVLNKDSVILK